MIFKNKLVISLILLIVIAGGMTFMFNTMKVIAGSDNKTVQEDSSFTNIEVTTNNAEVIIVPTKISEATVEYTGANKKKKYIFNVDVKGDTLTVQLKQKRRFLSLFNFHTGDLKLTVNVPEKQYKDLQVKSDNGRIMVENLQVEKVLLETDNGQIQVKEVEAKTVKVESDNGKIILDHVQGEINGSTDNGKISLITNKIEWPIDLETDNGSIEVKTESEPKNTRIDAKTDNGIVNIFGDKDSYVTYGNGKSLIKLRTDNGPITVTK
ncbi:hypothetical protein HMPREF1210_02968 [Paenisporosarcina sp. HGH0030]|uniref:DUF4097 family beta strand repeat-containing protein n=1 Tax=Paenisporosarcina sp. HGH0030 TaxID=1078085 RepID=UPI00034E7649|nr:DUF4097 family beta strand repeat-containing protein [Paenisporosarcina sp. HGH0030]EPD50120.1 hypothetical protein HMPREF1210_02968 [Paenisporosarcina sp. HGH0030]